MNKREAAIVSAYTGKLLGSFTDMSEYCEKILGRPIWTQQYLELADEIKEKSREDFIKMEIDSE